jgi:catechol 2,3-dioxygenase-like lactoylglutathione lyase family enzyme
MTERPVTNWPEELAAVGAIRFNRRYYHFEEAVSFFRDLVGLPLYETFEGSYGSNGAIFALPTPALTFEVVEATEPVALDPHEQLCLYFPNEDTQQAAMARLQEAGVEPLEEADCHPYWVATGAVTYRDPDGREVVFAPFVYGANEPAASSAQGDHRFGA